MIMTMASGMAIWLMLLLSGLCRSEIADYNYEPKGDHPTLYEAGVDPIVQLDDTVFNDTIQHTDTAFIIEFYADWCGHCRAFAPFYKAFATDVRRWRPVVHVAAVNCGDPFNAPVCRQNLVNYYPLIKYFQRNDSDGSIITTQHTVSKMRNQLTDIVVEEYSANEYPDWPQFPYVAEISTYGELWAGTAESAQHLAVVFEMDNNSYVGAQLLLDLSEDIDRVGVRRCVHSHPLAAALLITDLPSLVVFQRNHRLPVYQSELRRMLMRDLEGFLGDGKENSKETSTESSPTTAAPTILSCQQQPQRCGDLFYASETDMLKATRYALFREVPRFGRMLHGRNLTALVNFLHLLASDFPRSRLNSSLDEQSVLLGGQVQRLERSERARAVFADMGDWLKEKGLGPVSVREYKAAFVDSQRRHDWPFPVKSGWEHCRGTRPHLRGYTCGLWTTFHALTVQSFLNNGSDANYDPLSILTGVRGWVDYFFGCRQCRDHFIKMTTHIIPMETQVNSSLDVLMYLWKAHNLVNERLRGNKGTEDPQFPKQIFPPDFLCPQCRVDGVLNEDRVSTFIIDYYSNIRPHKSSIHQSLRFI